MSSDPQEIGPGVSVRFYRDPAHWGSSTRTRFVLAANGYGLNMSYEQMCALRRWFLGPDVPAEAWGLPAGCEAA